MDPDRLPPADDTVRDFLAQHGPGGLALRMGVEIHTVSGQQTVARMPVAGNTQPMGLLHGGGSAALAETVGSLAAACWAPSGHSAVGVELSATHHRSANEGHVLAIATPIHVGRRVATFTIDVTHEETDRLLSTVRLTCMFVAPRSTQG